MLRRIAIALALLAPTPVLADFQTGNQLLSNCTAEGKPTEQMLCYGYIAAIADAMSTGNPVNRFNACPPDGVRTSQLKDIVVSDLRRNPTERHYGAVGLVAMALAGAFPCK